MVAKLAALLTVLETAVLVRWLALTRYAATRVFAAGFFFFGIAVEEIVRFMGVRKALGLPQLPTLKQLGGILGGVAVEILGWSIPLLLHLPFAQTALVLFVFLDVEHSIIRTVTNPASRVIDQLFEVSDYSAMEALGGALWLVNPNPTTLTIMIATSFFEHAQGIRDGLGLRS